MRTLSQQVFAIFPTLLGLVLVLLTATPLDSALPSLTPNIAWLMTLVMVAAAPRYWPYGVAFALGLLQDFLFGTPLGSQALLALVLAQWVALQTRRQQSPPFRMRWLEAAGVLVFFHVLLWAVMHVVRADGASVVALLRAGLVNALWYPLFYACARKMESSD
jgi:rod shape-determining protein MreD